MNTGIYEIVNTVNGKRYVGSAMNLRTRWITHRHRLNNRKHHSKHLQSSWIKHGESAFVFRKILICAVDNLIMYEQRAIDVLRPEYNSCPVAGSARGVKHSDEVRAKQSLRSMGNKHALGYRHTPEALAKIAAASAAMKGKIKRTLGMKHSAETKAKLSAARMGNKHSSSPEARAKISAANLGNRRCLGYKHTTEARANMSAAHKGKPSNRKGAIHSEETRAKLRDAWVRRKARGNGAA